jgi:hypothetical protein
VVLRVVEPVPDLQPRKKKLTDHGTGDDIFKGFLRIF